MFMSIMSIREYNQDFQIFQYVWEVGQYRKYLQISLEAHTNAGHDGVYV